MAVGNGLLSGSCNVVMRSRNWSNCFNERPLWSVSRGRIAGTPTEAHGSMAAKLARLKPIATPVDGMMAVSSGALELPLMTAVLNRAGCWCCCCCCCCCWSLRLATKDWRWATSTFNWPGIEWRWRLIESWSSKLVSIKCENDGNGNYFSPSSPFPPKKPNSRTKQRAIPSSMPISWTLFGAVTPTPLIVWAACPLRVKNRHAVNLNVNWLG